MKTMVTKPLFMLQKRSITFLIPFRSELFKRIPQYSASSIQSRPSRHSQLNPKSDKVQRLHYPTDRTTIEQNSIGNVKMLPAFLWRRCLRILNVAKLT